MSKLLLNNTNIDVSSLEVEEFLAKAGVERKNILQIKLAVEEALLDYQETFGKESLYTLKCVKHLNRLRVEMSVPGERQNPFDTDDETSSEVMRGIVAGMGLAPIWQYTKGTNQIIFTPRRKKRSQLWSLVTAIISACIIGALLHLLPQTFTTFLSNQIITPIIGTFMGFLSAVAGPMIFLSVTWGIYSIGDTSTLNRVGKRLVGCFLGASTAVALLCCIIMLPFFEIGSGSQLDSEFSSLFSMVLDIFPSNLFTPFTEGNPMQIIFVAIIIGLAMLILGAKTTVVATFVEQVNYIVQLIMEIICSLIPLFVFISILNMILLGNISEMGGAYKLLLLLLLGCTVPILICTLLVSLCKKINPMLLIKKLFPTFLIAFTTGSSSAAFATNVETCEKQLGIDKKIVNCGVPLGHVIFMPGFIVLCLAAGLSLAEIYGVTISVSWLITAMLISVILAIAAPPIPGSAITCYAILFAQLNIPIEGITILVAFNIVVDAIGTSTNLFCLQSLLVMVADSLDMLDITKLRTKQN
jgi:Na+/H+-dicarboxylate symporter